MLDPVELAAELIRIRSPSGSEGDLADFLIRTLRRFMDVERGPLGAVVGRLQRGEGPTVALEGHMDTVPPGDEASWSVAPYAGAVEEGLLYGRGAVDMKGAIAAQIAGVAAAQREVQGTLYLVYVTHEESAEGVVLGRVFEEIGLPDLVILGEPTDLRLGIGHRGRAIVRLVAKGRAAHAAMPELGVNAVEKLLRELPRALQRELPRDPLLGKGTQAVTSVSTPTSGPIIPDRCVAEIDRRILPGETRDSVLGTYKGLELEVGIAKGELRSYTGEAFLVEYFFPAWVFPPQEGFIQWAWQALGRPPFRIWRFSTDGVMSAGVLGIPTFGYGPGEESLAHQANEHVPVGDIVRAAEGYRKLVTRMGELSRIPLRRGGLGG